MMQLIALFRQRDWRITFASAAAKSQHAADLSEQGVTSATIKLNDPSFDSFVSELSPDVVLFDRFMTEEQFGWRVMEQCPDALRVLNTEDLHCLRHARHEAVKAGRAAGWGVTEIGSAELVTDMAKREVAAILRSDLSIMISQPEIILLTDRFKVDAVLLHYTPLMVPPATPAWVQPAQPPPPPWPSFDERRHFVTIGNFRHAPNWDGVLQLKQVIWPLIKARVKDAELHVYGSYPPAKATQLSNERDRFLVRGWAEDAHAVMRQARLCLAPLRFGAGLKGKLMSAMRAGTPSVTTPIGAEGLSDAGPWCGAVVQTPESFADEAVRLYQDEVLWRGAQQRGVEMLLQFDEIRHGGGLLYRIDAVRRELAAHRAANFTGAMLRHHSMLSTRYMARWIEAKNR